MIRPIKKILIANRGEIALRIARTAQRMDIASVAIYSDADFKSNYVKQFNEAYRVGPAASDQSYLNIDRIIEIIKESGADAVHPGYGFLSENYRFVERLTEEGITFIGPSASSMKGLGDKITSKEIAKKAGVNIVPGYQGEVENEEHVMEIAKDIGFPVMIKASAGGGGKGMRIARNEADVRAGFKISQEEALKSFGDSRILVEKFVENPKHIEFQLLGDKHGNYVYLPERDCSVQRRNQKVFEESPCPTMTEELRQEMGNQATQLARAVDYHTTGTVEYLLDKDSFYFLEMNTRLQVEHCVTEEVTGLDLVEQMIKIAEGREMDLKQDQVNIKGHAIEARIYAEDPARGFLPSPNCLVQYQEPKMDNIRIDTAMVEGEVISMHYDPMISKLITRGEDRAEALGVMGAALDNYVIRGPENNVTFCRDVLMKKPFSEGWYNTGFLEAEYGGVFTPTELEEEQKLLLAGVGHALHMRDLMSNQDKSQKYPRYAKIGNEFFTMVKSIKEGKEETFIGRIDESSGEVKGKLLPFSFDLVEFNQTTPIIRFQIPHGQTIALQYLERTNRGYKIRFMGNELDVDVLSPYAVEAVKYEPPPVDTAMVREVLSPMTGRVKEIGVKIGDKIGIGQSLVVLEAMKMLNPIISERAGTVKRVAVDIEGQVNPDDLLVEFE